MFFQLQGDEYLPRTDFFQKGKSIPVGTCRLHLRVIGLGIKAYKHYIIVIEDLDRIESKESVLQFLREFRKYYLTNGGKHNISFIVCIKPEALLQTENDKNKLHEYKKIFDYTINLHP